MTFEECLLLWKEFEGQTDPTEGVELYNAVINTPPGAVVEVGSASGGTTIILIKAAELVGKMVYSIDIYPEELEGKALHCPPGLMRALKDKFKKNILNGDYKNIIQFNTDVKGSISKLPKELSVVFIDGCHEFSFVQEEFNLLYPLVIAGGWIFIHDTTWELGQISLTEETALKQVWHRINKELFSEIKKEGSMFCGRK